MSLFNFVAQRESKRDKRTLYAHVVIGLFSESLNQYLSLPNLS